MQRILTDASGSLTSAYLVKAIKDAGCYVIASDVDPGCFCQFLSDDFIIMPPKKDPELWNKIYDKLFKHKVDLVIPSFDETLTGWAKRKNELLSKGVSVIISPEETISLCQDKWRTYLFFKENNIPTPETSLNQDYPLIKPVFGRGSEGVEITKQEVCMDGMISQELISGDEYTVDVLCDINSKPIYIVPRKREKVCEGKSVEGVVVDHPDIENIVKKICNELYFVGPVNMQYFICTDGQVKFIEINPRIAGGMALSFAATENWIKLIIDNIVMGRNIKPKTVKYGLRMKRYYAEIFVS